MPDSDGSFGHGKRSAGISSVSVFVNGALVQNCSESGIATSATCAATIYGSNFPSGSTIAVYGQEVNQNGVPTISATSNLSVAVGSSTSGSVTLGFSPNATTLAIGDTMTVQVTAYDTLGVTGLSVFVNGSRIQNCSASGATAHATCSATLSGSNYTNGAVIAIYGQASDTEGTSIVSPTSNITITPGTATLNGTVSLSFSPYATSLATGQSTTVSVFSTSASSDVSSIEVYVNDALVHTCTFPGTSSPELRSRSQRLELFERIDDFRVRSGEQCRRLIERFGDLDAHHQLGHGRERIGDAVRFTFGHVHHRNADGDRDCHGVRPRGSRVSQRLCERSQCPYVQPVRNLADGRKLHLRRFSRQLFARHDAEHLRTRGEYERHLGEIGDEHP